MGALRAMKRKNRPKKTKSLTFFDRERIKTENLLLNAAPELQRRIQEETWGLFICVFAAWLRVHKGYGKKRIASNFADFVGLADILINEETTPAQIAEMLKDETGYDLFLHAKQLQDEAKEEKDNGLSAGQRAE